MAVSGGDPNTGPDVTAKTLRIPAVDAARGVALVAMAVYHFTWDLGFFGFIELQAGIDPAWRLFAKVIAAAFLLLVGVSLVLATRHGLRPGPFLRRLGMVTLAALGITLATWFATPDSFIFFGILHCIAVSTVLALPLLRAPLWWLGLVAILIAGAPRVLASTSFEGPAWWWLGLGLRPPLTNDFVPLLPWFAAVIGGIILARVAIARGWDVSLARWTPGRAGRLLSLGGRHSLLVYLVHQPVFFGLLWLAAAAGVPKAQPSPAAFVGACTANCVATTADAGFCRSTCACVADRLAAERLMDKVVRGALTPAQEEKVRAAAQLCRAEQQPDAKP